MGNDVKKRKMKITGRKHRCNASQGGCGHVHKQLGQGKAWMCMKRGCKCPGMIVGGQMVK
jgi:hypothetical protein